MSRRAWAGVAGLAAGAGVLVGLMWWDNHPPLAAGSSGGGGPGVTGDGITTGAAAGWSMGYVLGWSLVGAGVALAVALVLVVRRELRARRWRSVMVQHRGNSRPREPEAPWRPPGPSREPGASWQPVTPGQAGASPLRLVPGRLERDGVPGRSDD